MCPKDEVPSVWDQSRNLEWAHMQVIGWLHRNVFQLYSMQWFYICSTQNISNSHLLKQVPVCQHCQLLQYEVGATLDKESLNRGISGVHSIQPKPAISSRRICRHTYLMSFNCFIQSQNISLSKCKQQARSRVLAIPNHWNSCAPYTCDSNHGAVWCYHINWNYIIMGVSQ